MWRRPDGYKPSAPCPLPAKPAEAKALPGYHERSVNLSRLGYPSYVAYLRSKRWRKLRRKAFKRARRRCYCCGSRATEIHHRRYDLATLRHGGSSLVAICRPCHESIEFVGGAKARLEEANERLEWLRDKYATRRAGAPECGACCEDARE